MGGLTGGREGERAATRRATQTESDKKRRGTEEREREMEWRGGRASFSDTHKRKELPWSLKENHWITNHNPTTYL